MREIKFRAWSGKVMLYPTDNLHITFNEGYYHLENCYEHEGYDIPCKWDGDKSDCILMQFTGLKDKNGKEIYEGDIVKCKGNYGNGTGVIIWLDRSSRFMIKEKCNFEDNSNLTGCYAYNNIGITNAQEVIGNKFENPELI